MKRVLAVLTVGVTGVFGAVRAEAQQAAPDAPAPPPAALRWAYPVNPPAPAGARGGGGGRSAAPAASQEPLHLPGTDRSFTRSQITAAEPADWRPDLHPAMPEIVAKGRAPAVRACALCHYPNGQGRPENGPVAGLPKEYILQQLRDFHSGARKSSEPRMGPPANMVRIAKAMTPEEMDAAADYFSSFGYRPWVQVKEATTVPKLKIAGGMFVPDTGTEPIGQRVVEVPEHPDRTELRDPASGFVAYVPPGTLAKGEALAKGSKTTACTACHGADLRGLGPVPPIAGRTVSYITRQLNDFRSGARAGSWSALMKPVVDGLTDADMMAVAAYVASQKP